MPPSPNTTSSTGAVVREHGDDCITPAGVCHSRGPVRAPVRAPVDQRLRFAWRAVVDGDVVAGREQALRHRGPHAAAGADPAQRVLTSAQTSTDQLLVSIARRLEKSVRAGDSFVARLGGDEFSILLESIKTCGRSPERIFFTDKPSHTKLKVRADTFFCVTFYLEDANRTAKPTHKLEKLSNDSSE